MSALIELSKTRGFYQVTMDELAAAAGLSKRTLYRYFAGKDEIIEAVVDNFMERMGAEIDRLISARRTPEEVMTFILNNLTRVGRIIINPLVMDDLRRHYPHLWKKIDDYRMGRLQQVIPVLLDEGNREFTREIDPRIVATVLVASTQAVLNPEFILSNGLTFEEAVSQLVEFFKHGFIKA